MGKLTARASSIALITILVAVCSAQTGKVEKVGALTDAAVPEAVRRTLDPGYRVLLDDGTPVCELWLRKSVPASEKPGAAKGQILFPFLAE